MLDHFRVGILYLVDLADCFHFLFHECFLLFNDETAQIGHGIQIFLHISFLSLLCGMHRHLLYFLFFSSEHNIPPLFKYRTYHRLVHMLIIVLFSASDNAHMLSKGCYVFRVCIKISFFLIQQITINAVHR